MKNIVLWICGAVSGLFVLTHLSFGKWFDWENDLVKLQPMNRGIMQVFWGLVVFVLLYMSITTFLICCRRKMDAGDGTLLGLYGGFYFVRAVLEVPFFGFSGQGLVIMLVCFGLAVGYLWNALSWKTTLKTV